VPEIGPDRRVREVRALGLECPPVLRRDRLGGRALDRRRRRAGDGVNVPRLHVAARCRARRTGDEAADEGVVDRRVEEPAAGDARVDRFEDVHGAPALSRSSL
jgi:hypothetical protein